MDSGVDDFLHKPFDRDRFIARVRVAMRILDLHQSLRLANTDSVRTDSRKWPQALDADRPYPGVFKIPCK